MGQRTPAMTSFGVLSIALGVFYAVMSVIMFLGGPSKGGAAEAAGAGGAVAVLIWGGSFVASLLLMVSGFGFLKCATWSRTLCLASCVLGLIVFGLWTKTTWFHILPSMAVIYTVILGAWAWSGLPGSGTASKHAMGAGHRSSGDDETKAAA